MVRLTFASQNQQQVIGVIFRLKIGFSIVVLGPFEIKPPPVVPLGGVDPSGELALDFDSGNDMTCESKGGGVGAEELQCWESSNDSNPKINTFKNVKNIGGGSRRRLDAAGRRLQSGDNQFNCVLSPTDLTGLDHISINIANCPVSVYLSL